MSRKFKAGDTVKLEGKLVAVDDHDERDIKYALALDLGNKTKLTFDESGRLWKTCTKTLELVKAAPVVLAIGQQHTVGAVTRVILEIAYGTVFYRFRPTNGGAWQGGSKDVGDFERNYCE